MLLKKNIYITGDDIEIYYQKGDKDYGPLYLSYDGDPCKSYVLHHMFHGKSNDEDKPMFWFKNHGQGKLSTKYYLNKYLE